MSTAVYNLYKRLILNYKNDYTEEMFVEMIDEQHEKGRLTDGEYNSLVAMIDTRFSE
jgi:hypothetical protein